MSSKVKIIRRESVHEEGNVLCLCDCVCVLRIKMYVMHSAVLLMDGLTKPERLPDKQSYMKRKKRREHVTC